MTYIWNIPNNQGLDEVLKSKFPGCKSAVEAAQLIMKSKAKPKPEGISVSRVEPQRHGYRRIEKDMNQENYEALSLAIDLISKSYDPEMVFDEEQLRAKKKLDDMPLLNADDVNRWRNGWLRLCSGL